MRFSMLLAVVAGFLIGVGWRTLDVVPLPTVLFILVLAGAMAVVRRRNGEAVSPPHLTLTIIFFVFVAVGVLRTEVASWQFDVSPLERSLGTTVTLEGVVVREPDQREQSVQLTVETSTDRILVTADRLVPVVYGDRVVVRGKLERPETFETDLGRTFDYPGYLRAKGVEYRISFAEMKVLGSGYGNPVIATLLTAKTRFMHSMRSVIPEPEAGLGSGLLLGVKSALGDDIEEDFRRTGIVHVVVLSGYNIMLVVSFFMFCVSFLLPRYARIAVGLTTIIAFALIVGLSATVVRASVMAALVLFADLFGRQYHVLRALLIAGLLMVLINPYLLVYDVGFQLSFMATLGLILIIPQFERLSLPGGTWFGVREFLLATVATQIAVLPLLMYHIGQVSLIAIVVNVLVLPMVPVAMLLTFLAGIVGLVFVVGAELIGYLAMWSLSYILAVAKWFAAVPLAAVHVPAFSAWGVGVLYLAYGAAGYWWYRRRQQVKNEFADWTIEIEPAGVSKGSPAGASEVPIFFR